MATPTTIEDPYKVGRVSNFFCEGNGVLLPCTSSTAARQFPALSAKSSSTDVMIVNTGSVAVFIAFGTATLSAVIPTDGISQNGICIPGGAIMVLCKGKATWVAGITATSTASVYLYQGYGS